MKKIHSSKLFSHYSQRALTKLENINSALVICLLIIFPFSTDLMGQSGVCLRCFDNPYSEISFECCEEEETYNPNILDILDRENIHYDFHKTIRKIREPSKISFFSNYRGITNDNGYQKKPFVLDGDLDMPIALVGPRWLGINTLHVLPRFKFRIFQNDENVPYGNADQSLPVRTPSAMPGIAWYWTHKNWWSSMDDPSDGVFTDKYLGLYLYHHSNGQDGNEIDTLLSPGEINLYNGNFSENIVFEFIIGGRHRIVAEHDLFFTPSEDQLDKVNDRTIGNRLCIDYATEKELHWKVGYEWHPNSLTNSVFNALDIYGRHRLNLSLSYLILPSIAEFVSDGTNWCMVASEKVFEKWRHTLNISYILDKDYNRGNTFNLESVGAFDVSRRLNINYTLYKTIPRSQNMAGFIQLGYFGSDEYNIYFNDSYWNARVGFAFAFFDQPNNYDLHTLSK